ncbi:MAG: EAL domain-containing protein [Lachnospiraceae bacterium]|nr:EAL domain-containing protein [Lachnospiraceae bacterium]
MYYHIEFDIAAIFLTLFIIYYIIFKKGLVRHANRVYLVLVLLDFIAVISDIMSSVANNRPDYSERIFQDFWNYVYHFSHTMIAYVFVVYLFFLLGFVKKKQKTMYAVSVPIIAGGVLLLSNPLTKWLFYYDAEGYYRHGKLFAAIYAIALFYMFYSIFFAFRYRKMLGKSRFIPLLAFLFISFGAIVFQIFFQEYLITLFFENIGFMGILFTIENKDDTISPATGIFNRYAFQTALESAMSTEGYTLILVKIANLNYYNKVIGFQNMNGILNKISVWIEQEYKLYACYDCGRGHLAVLCDKISEEALESGRKAIYERFDKPWGRGKFSLTFPVQYGVIHLPEDVKTMENLMMLVDAPFDGKEYTELDVKAVISEYERRVLIEHLIDKALKNKTFQVYYQPIWNSQTGKVQSAEALCRLIDEEYGIIPPDEFIPIAEQNGTILEIGRFVFDEVCRFYQEGGLKSRGVDYIEVNLSVVQCMSRNLKEMFEEILNKYSLDAKCINLEITESATAGNQKLLSDSINMLREVGFTFSLDDYGTGYSNISIMYEMPFSIIKIDKSILWKAMDPKTGEGQRSAVIYLENTIRMLQDMNYSVLVEGVETMDQKMLLERFDCDYFQGYYFSKPVQKQVFLDYLRVVNA